MTVGSPVAVGGMTPVMHCALLLFVFLRDDFSAYYFDEYAKQLPLNLAHNPHVCLLLVDSSNTFWLSSLFKGRFASSPGIRLHGVAGERRVASEQEKAAYRARVKSVRKLRGYDLIWRDLNHVRDIKLERFDPVVYPKMTDHLWR